LEAQTLQQIFNNAVQYFGNRPALTYVNDTPLTYTQVGKNVQAISAHLQQLGINMGDKVAILSDNSPNWAMSFYAITSMGAVAVPLLTGFSEEEIVNILTHAEVKVLLVSDKLKYKTKNLTSLENVFVESLDNFLNISEIEVFQNIVEVNPDDLAAIIYTSGTTGRSKGVMLSHGNIAFTAYAAKGVQNITTDDRFLSILPLSHTYENTLGLILPFIGGACIYYLKSTLTSPVMMDALQKVKPTILLSVPMIIEKVFRSKILPVFEKNILLRAFYKVRLVQILLHKVAGKKLMNTFGGELKFFGVGGAKIDAVVEKFLLDAHFPIAIGYGLTETSPLLAGTSPQTARWQSTGPSVEGVELKINDPDAETGIGEIWAKGPNVMKGYYKEPELTAEVITPDGWFKTGDLARIGKSGHFYIKGRNKNLILGSGGENIYPEDIESLINGFKYVMESLVIEKNGRLVAMVHFNIEELEKKYHYLKEQVNDFVQQ
jgi:long-chain acyl-CoA synthetase